MSNENDKLQYVSMFVKLYKFMVLLRFIYCIEETHRTQDNDMLNFVLVYISLFNKYFRIKIIYINSAGKHNIIEIFHFFF